MSGSWTKRDEIVLVERLCDLGKYILAEDLHDRTWATYTRQGHKWKTGIAKTRRPDDGISKHL
jgi:hypothetical protein